MTGSVPVLVWTVPSSVTPDSEMFPLPAARAIARLPAVTVCDRLYVSEQVPVVAAPVFATQASAEAAQFAMAKRVPGPRPTTRRGRRSRVR
ncbi:hypothetical protein ACFQZ4_12470 [Catellatospora coxensis]